MPLMLFRFYRVIRSWRKGRDFFARLEYKQDGIPSCRGCGHCGVVFYDHYYRKAKVASIDGRIYDVIIKARRYRCPKCGRIYREPIRGLKENKRISENAKDEIINKYLDGATNKKISKRLGISQSTVERVIHERFEIKVKEQLSYEYAPVGSQTLDKLLVLNIYKKSHTRSKLVKLLVEKAFRFRAGNTAHIDVARAKEPIGS